MAGRQVYLRHIGLARAGLRRDARRHGAGVAADKFRPLDHANPLHEPMQGLVLKSSRAEGVESDATVTERHGHAVGKTVVGGFSRRGPPLFLVSADDFDRDVVTADLNVLQLRDRLLPLGGKQGLPQGQRGFDGGLCVVLDRKMFDVGVEDLERRRFLSVGSFSA